MPVRGSGVLVLSWSLLIRGILAALRQKFHLSTCPNLAGHLFLVVAVTHTPPREDADAVPFPVDLKGSIGLDDRPAWIVTTEGNAFTWPGPDVRPVPRRNPRTVVYGPVPPDLLQRIAASYLVNRARQRGRIVSRTD